MRCGGGSRAWWAGLGCLLVGVTLSVVGVASPHWRHQEQDNTLEAHMGLWQMCNFTEAHEDAICKINDEDRGVWRAVQIMKGIALCLLLLAVGAACGSDRRGEPDHLAPRDGRPRPCPCASILTWLGALLSVVGDLQYVGYVEMYVTPDAHLTNEDPGNWYEWSFACCVAGSVLILLAALALTLADFFYREPKPWERYTIPALDTLSRPLSYLNPEFRLQGASGPLDSGPPSCENPPEYVHRPRPGREGLSGLWRVRGDVSAGDSGIDGSSRTGTGPRMLEDWERTNGRPGSNLYIHTDYYQPYHQPPAPMRTSGVEMEEWRGSGREGENRRSGGEGVTAFSSSPLRLPRVPVHLSPSLPRPASRPSSGVVMDPWAAGRGSEQPGHGNTTSGDTATTGL